MELVVRIALAAVLAFSAASKLADARGSTAAMATFGFSTPASRRVAWTVAVLAEAALAVGVAAGSDRAAHLAAALMLLFALTLGMCAISAVSAIVKVTKIDPVVVFNR